MKASIGIAPQRRIVVTASSMGGIAALIDLLKRLPPDFPAPIVAVQHRGTALPSFLAEVLQRETKLRVVHGHTGERLRPGHVYVASPEQHIVIRDDHSLRYVDGRRINFLRSSADPLFESASEVYGRGTIGVILTGYDRDATVGAQAIKAHGGTVIAQSPETCEVSDMPRSAIRTGAVDMVLPIEEIAPTLVRLVERDHDGVTEELRE
jgi:two-component system chemotaxis response regulator CheB